MGGADQQLSNYYPHQELFGPIGQADDCLQEDRLTTVSEPATAETFKHNSPTTRKRFGSDNLDMGAVLPDRKTSTPREVNHHHFSPLQPTQLESVVANPSRDPESSLLAPFPPSHTDSTLKSNTVIRQPHAMAQHQEMGATKPSTNLEKMDRDYGIACVPPSPPLATTSLQHLISNYDRDSSSDDESRTYGPIAQATSQPFPYRSRSNSVDSGSSVNAVLGVDDDADEGTWREDASLSGLFSKSSPDSPGRESLADAPFSSRPPLPPIAPRPLSGGTGLTYGSQSTSSFPNPSPLPLSRPYQNDRKAGYPKGATGLGNLGNTCFMNSALQCLSNTALLTHFFLGTDWQKDINKDNPLGLNGRVAIAYVGLIENLWTQDSASFSPRQFKTTIGDFNSMFTGYSQQDSQELLQSLLDGLHEDLNRIRKKPYVEIPEMKESDAILAQKSWDYYKLRNDSIIVDTFQGQLKSRVKCQVCEETSIKFDPYMFLSLPIPNRNVIRIKLIAVYPYTRNQSNNLLTLTFEGKKDILVCDVKTKALELLGCDTETSTLMAEMWGSTIYRIWENHAHFSPSATDDILLYLAPEISIKDFYFPVKELSATSTETTCVFAYLQMDERDTNRWSEPKAFGIPILIPFPKHISIDLDDINPTLPEDERSQQLYSVFGECIYPYVCQALQPYALINLNEPDLFSISISVCSDSDAKQYSAVDNFFRSGYKFADRQTFLYPLPKVDSVIHEPHMELSSECLDTIDERELSAKGHAVELSFGSMVLLIRLSRLQAAKIFGVDTPLLVNNPWMGPFKPIPSGASLAEEDASVKKKITLQDCIAEFRKEELLGVDDTWFCPQCKTHVQIKKKLDIWNTPSILIFHLKRFSSGGGRYSSVYRSLNDKIDDLVDAPLSGLDLNNVVLDGSFGSESCVYDLYAVSNHYGGMGGGHYTAYACNAIDGKWYDFDDSRVTALSGNGNIVVRDTSASYLLFYQRRGAAECTPDLSQAVQDFLARARESSVPRVLGGDVTLPMTEQIPLLSSPYYASGHSSMSSSLAAQVGSTTLDAPPMDVPFGDDDRNDGEERDDGQLIPISEPVCSANGSSGKTSVYYDVPGSWPATVEKDGWIGPSTAAADATVSDMNAHNVSPEA